jgi:hypothetical protein
MVVVVALVLALAALVRAVELVAVLVARVVPVVVDPRHPIRQEKERPPPVVQPAEQVRRPAAPPAAPGRHDVSSASIAASRARSRILNGVAGPRGTTQPCG